MTAMTPFDDELARQLRAFPAAPPRPLGEIESRARTLRRHRRAGDAGAALMAVATIGVVAFTPWWASSDSAGRSAAGPIGRSAAPVVCPRTVTDAQSVVDQAVNDAEFRLAGPEDVPEAMRLLWPDAQAAETAWAGDYTRATALLAPYEDTCPALPMQDLTVLDLQDATVARVVRVIHVEVPYVRAADSEARTLDAGGTIVSVQHQEAGKGLVSASWGSGDSSWTVVGRPLSDDEIVELVGSARYSDGAIGLGEWSVSAAADQLVPGNAGNAAAGSLVYEVSDDRLDLTVERGTEGLWQRAGLGYELVEVGGRPGLLNVEPTVVSVTWQPADGVLATLRGSGDPAALLALAESVAPVPADDPVLTASWQADPGASG